MKIHFFAVCLMLMSTFIFGQNLRPHMVNYTVQSGDIVDISTSVAVVLNQAVTVNVGEGVQANILLSAVNDDTDHYHLQLKLNIKEVDKILIENDFVSGGALDISLANYRIHLQLDG